MPTGVQRSQRNPERLGDQGLNSMNVNLGVKCDVYILMPNLHKPRRLNECLVLCDLTILLRTALLPGCCNNCFNL